MNYTVYAGCSFTSGSGFALEKNEPLLWVNQIHDYFFAHTIKLNIGKGGRSNSGIFQDTIKTLLEYPVEYAIVEWTSMPRYELELGLETYSTQQSFIPNGPCRSHNLNNVTYNQAYLESIRDRFTSLAHDWYEIVNLIEYTNSINKLAKLTNTRVFFVNGICPWDQKFFTKKQNVLPDQYTDYTQHLINVNTRDDAEIFQIYDKLHNSIVAAGGINESQWLNLYQSMRDVMVDVNSDDRHPGTESNNLFVEIFSKVLKTQLI